MVYSDVQICFLFGRSAIDLPFAAIEPKNTVEGLKLWNQHCLRFFFPLLYQTCILIHQNRGDIFPILNRIGRVLKWLLALVCDQIKSYFELSLSVSVIRNTLMLIAAGSFLLLPLSVCETHPPWWPFLGLVMVPFHCDGLEVAHVELIISLLVWSVWFHNFKSFPFSSSVFGWPQWKEMLLLATGSVCMLGWLDWACEKVGVPSK